MPNILRRDIYIERVLEGLNYSEYSEEEREKLQQLRLTLYYRTRRLDWYGFFLFLGMFLLAFAKNILEGYNFENGVIFGFTIFGLTITFIPLTRNIRNHIEKLDVDILFDEKKILEKYVFVEETKIEPKENDSNGKDSIHKK